jgi:CheY-like chemotaxis protein
MEATPEHGNHSHLTCHVEAMPLAPGSLRILDSKVCQIESAVRDLDGGGLVPPINRQGGDSFTKLHCATEFVALDKGRMMEDLARRILMASDANIPRGTEFTTRSTKVLLVDEEAGDIRFLRLILEGQGFEVSTCTNYEAAVRSLDTAPYDFVLVSQGSQAFEGRAVLDRAMQLDRHRPVMVVTRCMDMQCYLEAMQMGAIDYLEKPVRPSELLRFVKAHVPHGSVGIQGSAA